MHKYRSKAERKKYQGILGILVNFKCRRESGDAVKMSDDIEEIRSEEIMQDNLIYSLLYTQTRSSIPKS